MPMGQNQKVAIALFACLVLWCGWQSRASWQHPILPPSEYPHQQSAAPTAGDENKTQNLNWNNWTSDPVAVFTGLLTLFNGLLFVSTIGLWLANRKTARIAERALIDLERPWTLITNASVHGIFSDPPFIEIEKGNFGRAAGTIAGIQAGIKIYSFEIDPASIKMTEHPLDEVGNAMIPGNLYRSKISLKPYKESQVSAGIEAGAYNFVVRAVLSYRGLTRTTYETGFCFRYVAERNQFFRYGGEKYNYTK
jgi:hypothetical protein